MKPFAVRTRAADVGRRGPRGSRAQPGAKFLGRRHEPRRPDEGRTSSARRSSSTSTALPLAADRATPDGGLRIGALATNSDAADHPLMRAALPAAVAGDAGRSVAAAAQHGDRSAATCCSAPAATTSTTPASPCNKREPGTGCAALEASIACTRSSAPASTASPSHPVRHVRRAAPRSTRWSGRGRRTARARDPDRRLPPPARRRPRSIDTDLAARRAHHRDRPAASAFAHGVALPEGARPRALRVRAGLGGRRPGARRRPVRQARVALGGVAHKPWRAARRRRRCAEQPRDGGDASGAPPTPRSRKPGRSRTTRSRSSWRSGRSCGR